MPPVNPPRPGGIIASWSGTAYSTRQVWLISQLTSISEGLSPIRHPGTRLVGDGRPTTELEVAYNKHPRYNKADPYYLLTRREQVTVFRLRTGHNRLNYHLYSGLGQATTASTITCIPNSALAIRSSALAVLAVRQQNICCSSAPPTSHSERESGQTTLP